MILQHTYEVTLKYVFFNLIQLNELHIDLDKCDK